MNKVKLRKYKPNFRIILKQRLKKLGLKYSDICAELSDYKHYKRYIELYEMNTGRFFNIEVFCNKIIITEESSFTPHIVIY